MTETHAIIDYFVSKLHKMRPYDINLDKRWFSNIQGSAIGAMYIIHTNEWLLYNK
jgi:hypothetical protein